MFICHRSYSHRWYYHIIIYYRWYYDRCLFIIGEKFMTGFIYGRCLTGSIQHWLWQMFDRVYTALIIADVWQGLYSTYYRRCLTGSIQHWLWQMFDRVYTALIMAEPKLRKSQLLICSSWKLVLHAYGMRFLVFFLVN